MNSTSNSAPIDRRSSLSCLIHVLGILREHQTEMSIQTAQLFLTIAQHPGLLPRDVSPLSGMTQATTSRHLKTLVSTDPVEGGLGLVVKQYAVDNPRRHALHLSRAGRVLAERLVKAHQGAERTTGKVAVTRARKGYRVVTRQAVPPSQWEGWRGALN
ncbi:MarR family winged helix-turn-helix transcriptional regulator [Devosia ginsengisoli]|uniref:Winged helix-turn-helix transcriptional regulator n=1 Tax=Devosia ginsengisoli TaxID=400770 RepID=A0A5B8LQ52_9HYPH|nr:MarR family winged helix-turn-helix transcriptional regulator [Devosia ginsengisoli]QDZ10418.1 winged helix-turn-helix transcriptional regulator [Devosia ginsengisoli]